MKSYNLIFFLCLATFAGIAQSNKNATDSGTLLLHKFARNIGKETYYITKTDSGTRYDVTFGFTDRGTLVPLRARILVSPSFEAKELWIKGSTSRFSTINDSIVIKNQTAYVKSDDSSYTKKITRPGFLIAGYSPGILQMLLLQYWEKNGRPAVVNTLPAGSLRVKKEGMDTLNTGNKPLVLHRYIISGLIWGNEIIWTDAKGKLVCLITNDAEGDKVEMMAEPYAQLLPQLIAKAAGHSMRLFRESMGNKAPAANPIAITNANILDVESGKFIKNAVVLIRNGKIDKISTDGSGVSSNWRIIDGAGKTILPGLWDMHAHFQQAEWGPAYLAAGVTTVRDVGNEFEYINAIQQAINSGQGVGPNILKAGIIDGTGPVALGIVNATTKEEAIAVVQRYKQAGFVQIKIYSSVKPEIVKAIADEAHRSGLTVTGHVPEKMNALQAIDSGMDHINHAQYLYALLKKNAAGEINWGDSANQAMLEQLKQSKAVMDPTLGVYELFFRPLDTDIKLIEPAFETLPLPLQSLFAHTGLPADRVKSFKPMYDGMRSLIKVMHDKGIVFVAGTDMGFPGYSLARELELYVEAGLTPLQAIRTATIVPARVMGDDALRGSITEGKIADLVIVDGNPLENIRDIRKVKWVIKDGQVYDPKEMHRMAGFRVK